MWSCQSRTVSSEANNPVSVFRDRAVSYLELPAADIEASAAFYREALGWKVRDDSFTDGSGHVIGHWRTDLTVAGDSGIRPYIYTENIDQVLDAITACQGELVQPRYLEGDLWVAHFRDPAGNILGVWQHVD
jgi:predicted enzyme related to lactoylglutathione lyase